MEIRIFGVVEGGLPVCLGSKIFNISNYVGRIRHKMEVYLDESPLQRNKLHIQITIIPYEEGKKLTEAFLKGEPEPAADQQPSLQKLGASFTEQNPAQEE